MWRSLLERLAVASCLNLVVSGIASSLGLRFVNVFDVLCMLEGALLLIAGGGLDMVSSIFGTEARRLLSRGTQKYSTQHHRDEQKKATGLILLGFSFLAEAMLMSILVGG